MASETGVCTVRKARPEGRRKEKQGDTERVISARMPQKTTVVLVPLPIPILLPLTPIPFVLFHSISICT